ncbi:hypothetical protein OG21DRAFT_257792 [Imleria badia]|nr:hypothetical protein OG21DRAFT_257792 [Imleria badia]
MAHILTLIGVTSASSLGILLPAFKVVQQMADTYEHIKLGQKRWKVVIQRAALIIKEVHHGILRNDQSNITKLQKKFEEIQTILQKLADISFFKALIHFEDINKEIELANRILTDCSQLFLVSVAGRIG